MKEGYNFEYENDEVRYNAVRSFFKSLKKEQIIYETPGVLFIVCEYIVCKRFGSKEDNEELYFANLKDFYSFMLCAQPSFVPVERNDVPLEYFEED